jgi:hypothetical protein
MQKETTSSSNGANATVGSGLSPMYRLMIYFAHSTMVMYSADIVCNDKMTVAEFRDENETVCQRVFDEGVSIMNYELSYEQVSCACYVYLQSKYFPQSVKNNKVYTPS